MESSYGILKIVGVFGLALGLMAYELISVRKSIREDRLTPSDKPIDRDRSETRETDS